MADEGYSIGDILKSTDYALDIFTSEEISSIEIFDKRGKPYLRGFISGKERPATPEEIVRQLFLYRLIHTYGYPRERIEVEKGVQFGARIAEKLSPLIARIGEVDRLIDQVVYKLYGLTEAEVAIVEASLA